MGKHGKISLTFAEGGTNEYKVGDIINGYQLTMIEDNTTDRVIRIESRRYNADKEDYDFSIVKFPYENISSIRYWEDSLL